MLGFIKIDVQIDENDPPLLHILARLAECKSEDEAIGMLDVVFLDRDNLASINVSTRSGITPLIIAIKVAVEKNYPALIEYLCDKGANSDKVITYENGRCLTAINFAARLGHIEVGKILVRHKAVIDPYDVHGAYKSPLFDAIEYNQLEFFKFLCESLADIKQRTYVLSAALQNIFNIGNNKSEDEQISIIEILLDHGANINDTTIEGITILIQAIERNCPDIVKYLCKRGADVDKILTKINCGSTAINFAADFGYINIAKVLIEHGATIDYKDAARISPLYNAIEHNQSKFVRFLCEQEINVNVSDQFTSISPLYLALGMSDEERSLEIIRLLCESGARVTVNHLKILVASINDLFRVDDELIFGVLIAHIKDITAIEQFLKEDNSQIDNRSEIVTKAKKIIYQSFEQKRIELKLEFIKVLASEKDSLFHWLLMLDIPVAILQDLLFSSVSFGSIVNDSPESELIKANFFKYSMFNNLSENVELYLSSSESDISNRSNACHI